VRRYCKAFHLSDLRRFPGFREARPLAADAIVYVHQDFTVTESMWHGEDVVFDGVTPEWSRYCTESLGFRIPDDLAPASEEES
jgi:hypothetical protein